MKGTDMSGNSKRGKNMVKGHILGLMVGSMLVNGIKTNITEREQ